MKKQKNNQTVIFALIALLISPLAVVPQASAESSMLIQLNEQLNHETEQVKTGLDQLRKSSPHQKTAADWAAKVNTLPKGSKDFAYARAQYSKAVASDLELKFKTVTNIYRSAHAMTDTISQLSDAQKDSEHKRQSLFNSHDNAKTIQAKARQLKGLNDMFVTLIQADPSMTSRKLRQAYRVSKLQWRNTKLQASIPRGKGIDALQKLKDSSESIAYLAKAYLNGLKYQADIIQIVSIGGEANLVNSESEKVMGDAFDVLNPDGQAMKDMQMMLGSIDDEQTSVSYDIQGDPGISDEIDQVAAQLISQKQ